MSTPTRRNPHNPNSSDCLQALIELSKQYPEITESLIDIVGSDPTRLSKADASFAAHKYPDHTITYVQLYRKRAGVVLDLSARAHSIIMLLAMMAPQSLLVSFNTADIAAGLGASKSTVTAAIEQLKTTGMLAVHSKAVGPKPAIYRINPDLFKIGREPRLTADEVKAFQGFKIVREEATGRVDEGVEAACLDREYVSATEPDPNEEGVYSRISYVRITRKEKTGVAATTSADDENPADDTTNDYNTEETDEATATDDTDPD